MYTKLSSPVKETEKTLTDPSSLLPPAITKAGASSSGPIGGVGKMVGALVEGVSVGRNVGLMVEGTVVGENVETCQIGLLGEQNS